MIELDASYSPDVEIDHLGRVVWARDVKKGETVSIPVHMLFKVQADPTS